MDQEAHLYGVLRCLCCFWVVCWVQLKTLISSPPRSPQESHHEKLITDTKLRYKIEHGHISVNVLCLCAWVDKRYLETHLREPM